MQEVNALIYAAPLVPAVLISSIYGAANVQRLSNWAKRRIANSESASRRISESASQRVSEFTNLRIDEFANGESPLPPREAPLWGRSPAPPLLRSSAPLPDFPPPPREASRWGRSPALINLILGAVILTAALIYHGQYGYLPWGGKFRGWEEITDHHRRAARLVAAIPPEAKLSAQDRLNPHASQRETLYIYDRLDNADHIVLDVTEDAWPLHPVDLRHRVDQYLESGFGIVDAFDGYLLLARQPNLPTTLPDEFFDFARVADPAAFQPAFPVSVIFDDTLELVGYKLELGAHERFLPVATLYWRALKPLDQNLTLWPFLINRHGQVIEDPSQRPLVTPLWYPTARWAAGEIIITRTLPWNLAPNPGDEFTLAVGVSAADWASTDRRLAITQADSGLFTFDKNTWVRLNTFVRTGRKTYAPLEITTPPLTQTRQAQFWNLITLTGVDLPAQPVRAGQPLKFTLQWQAGAPITVDLTTFAHLLNQAGQPVAQLDWGPQDSLGYLPTSAWQPGRPVVDRQTLALPADVPPGQYRLVTGWYYAPTGQRLPLTTADRPGEQGDTATVGLITVIP
jgi:hypothetical protein